jgi:hypothetical protein
LTGDQNAMLDVARRLICAAAASVLTGYVDFVNMFTIVVPVAMWLARSGSSI